MTVAKGQDLIGKKLGTCVLERLLGYGGSSAVFLAQDQQSGREVAVKVFLPRDNPSFCKQKESYLYFRREAEVASKLDHPHILPIYAYGEENGLPYMVMPYMEGGTLADYMRTRGVLSLHEAQWYLEQLASAIDYVHQHGCVHCDIKPENMLLDCKGVVMLSDFGIAHVVNASEQDPLEGVRVSDAIIGTLDYLSPEQALGQDVDGRSDIYSLGVTLFFLLTKSLPFKADTPIATVLLHIHEQPPSLSVLRADIPSRLDSLLQRALEKDPERRFQSAGEFVAAFRAAVEDEYHKLSVSDRKEKSLSDNHAFGRLLNRRSNLSKRSPMVRQGSVSPWQRLIVMGLAGLLLFSVIGTVLLLKGKQTEQKPQVTEVSPTTVVLDDKLMHPDDWPVSKTFFFDSYESYHILNMSLSSLVIAPYRGALYGDFRLSVHTVVVRHTVGGSDYFGVMFRASTDQLHYYLFEISPDDGGSYQFLLYDGAWTTLSNGPLPTSIGGQEAKTLFVEAHGKSFSFSVNGTSIVQHVSVRATQFLAKGEIGLCVEDQGTEVAFSQLSIDTQS